jgi:L-ascorbate metabolism protein UlaG (beta-lactamase superfamily)
VNDDALSVQRMIRLTWLGQAGFRIDAGGTSFVVDPWATPHEHRLIPPPPLALAAEDIDCVLVTHEHFDHLDLPFLAVILERSPTAAVVIPEALAPLVEHVVPELQLVAVNPHDRIDVGGLSVDVVPALHGVTMEDAYGDGSAIGGLPRFVGYVLEADRRIYHAGDTIVTEELAAALRPLRVDVAMLPINGRDSEREARGIVGNMDPAEAVELALDIRATRLVPYHWDGFYGNTIPPGTVVDAAAARLHVVVPARFETLDL